MRTGVRIPLGDAVDSTACQASGYADSGSVRATVGGDAFSGTCVRVARGGGTLSVLGRQALVPKSNARNLSFDPTASSKPFWYMGPGTEAPAV